MIRSVARVVAFAGLLAASSAAAAANNNGAVNADFNNLDNLDADLVDLLPANDAEGGVNRRMQVDDTPSPAADDFATMSPTGMESDAPTPAPTPGDRGIDAEASSAPTQGGTQAETPGQTSAASATAMVPILSLIHI